MIKYKDIEQLIYQIVDVVVGNKLARIPHPSDPNLSYPAIIKEYQTDLKPKNPYISYDVRDTGFKNRRTSLEEIDENGNYVVYSQHALVARICCYADLNTARDVGGKIYSAFDRPSLIERITEVIPEMTFNRVSDLKTIQAPFGADWITETSFQVFLDYMDAEIDPFRHQIDAADIHVCLYPDETTPDFCFDIDTTEENKNDLI